MHRFSEIRRVVHRHARRFVMVVVGICVAYHVLLIAVPVARFGQLPNYLSVYDFPQAVRLILTGTPAVADMVWILLNEPLLETGFISPDFGIAEWSLILVPAKVGLALCLSVLLAMFLLLRRESRVLGQRGNGQTVGALSAGAGASCLALGSASLTWVVCCASPTWSVLLAFLGVSSSLALALAPLGNTISASGVMLLLLATWLEGQRLDTTGGPRPLEWHRRASHERAYEQQ